MANTTGKKYGGRKKGTANKVTRTIREAIAESADAYFNGQFQADIMSMDAHDRLAVWTRLMAYVIPKAQEENTSDGIFISFEKIAEADKADNDYFSTLSAKELTALRLALQQDNSKKIPYWLSGDVKDMTDEELDNEIEKASKEIGKK